MRKQIYVQYNILVATGIQGKQIPYRFAYISTNLYFIDSNKQTYNRSKSLLRQVIETSESKLNAAAESLTIKIDCVGGGGVVAGLLERPSCQFFHYLDE